MEIELLDGLIALFCILVGWLHMRQNDMEKALKEKAEVSELKKLETKLDSMQSGVVKLTIGQERCLVILENLAKINSKNG